MNARSHIQPRRDPLTNVLNQRGIEGKLAQSLKSLGAGQPFALAYLNLSSLELINDSYGRVAGDTLLKQICQRIEFLLTKAQYLARIGGNEFIILFQNCSIDHAKTISQKIIDDLRAAPCLVGTQEFQAAVSIGLVEAAASMEIQETISAAAYACRAAKKKNPHRVLVSRQNAQTFKEQAQHQRLLKELSSRCPCRRLFLEMQPIMSLQAPLDTLNFEVLIRMRDSNGGVISASKVIAAAEQNNIISVIDKWVFRTTLRWLDDHRLELPKTKFVCINLSGMSLNDEKFIDEFFVILNDFKHLSQMLCMEITESVALYDMKNTREFIRRLQALGVRTALDDFGAGYTSFPYLAELPADAIKIDGSFIKNISKHPVHSAIVEAIITLARNLGMKSIAEWVEDAPTLNMLREMGVDYVQGNIIAKPQHPARILEAADVGCLIIDQAVKASVCDALPAELLADSGAKRAPISTKPRQY
jgi:diguanylate cyclase (GGDEF)-like protein